MAGDQESDIGGHSCLTPYHGPHWASCLSSHCLPISSRREEFSNSFQLLRFPPSLPTLLSRWHGPHFMADVLLAGLSSFGQTSGRPQRRPRPYSCLPSLCISCTFNFSFLSDSFSSASKHAQVTSTLKERAKGVPRISSLSGCLRTLSTDQPVG